MKIRSSLLIIFLLLSISSSSSFAKPKPKPSPEILLAEQIYQTFESIELKNVSLGFFTVLSFWLMGFGLGSLLKTIRFAGTYSR